MSPEEAIRAAQDAIGTGRADDYEILPTKHADELEAKAPALAAILRRSATTFVAQQYEKKNAEAKQNQSIFLSTANKANWAVLLTACFSTLMLILAPLQIGGEATLPFLGACGVISGALGAMWVYRVREGNLLAAWMSARASAEAFRASYFEGVTNAEADNANSAVPPLLLQFEYFRRYHLDVQSAFYAKRAADHKKDADKMLGLSSLAVALAAISTGLAAVLGAKYAPLVAIAALGSVAAALSSFSTTKESVSQSRRNAERYTHTCDALNLLKAKLDDVRAAAAAGQKEAVKQFVSAVQDQLSAEHQLWLSMGQSIQPVIDRLEDTLSKLKPGPSSSAKAGG